MQHLNREFRHYLEKHLELTPEEITISTPNEIFDMVLAYEGHGEFAGYAIRRWIDLIYDVDLNDLSLDIFMKEEMERYQERTKNWDILMSKEELEQVKQEKEGSHGEQE